ncbi:MAG: hypothetical protein A3C15_02420 [Candidatus Magasanikbacteria bacterium RIFCSPHIGHO2_02_FULL_50_9b]|uniref:TNase-like domain-containing protein n=1 Tax=Candidatus Magasanikbacteria bacterium RIFCSPHIGHO2_02_FULL_50_9b TaxID=1798682 RepID=A0A1F6M7N7_9BACT|nr:MAG: hypothetical protein A3C15_02420 [Candidatus Magasanikbacteria bacterium RIFCSPHIGHO2_02_FULL_50_9b]
MSTLETIVAALALLLQIFSSVTAQQETISTTTSTIQVTRVIDGDTFEIKIGNTEEKVRMIGIDTPESVDPRRPVQCFGKEAGAHLRELFGNRPIKLEKDAESDDRDKYGRLLRYISFADNASASTTLNAQMITDGYAYAYTRFPFSRRAEYLKLQTAARDAQRGLWSLKTCRGKR